MRPELEIVRLWRKTRTNGSPVTRACALWPGRQNEATENKKRPLPNIQHQITIFLWNLHEFHQFCQFCNSLPILYQWWGIIPVIYSGGRRLSSRSQLVFSHAFKKGHWDWRIKDASCIVYPWARSVTSRSFSGWEAFCCDHLFKCWILFKCPLPIKIMAQSWIPSWLFRTLRMKYELLMCTV